MAILDAVAMVRCVVPTTASEEVNVVSAIVVVVCSTVDVTVGSVKFDAETIEDGSVVSRTT